MLAGRNIRYGLFKAKSTIGEIRVHIKQQDSYENIRLYASIDGHIRKIADIKTCCGDEVYKETKDSITVLGVVIYKPFIRCIREY